MERQALAEDYSPLKRRAVGLLRSIGWAFRSRQAIWIRKRLIAGAVDWPHPLSRSALVFAPHPDDETFGCGGLIAQKRAAGATVTVVILTDGQRGDQFLERPVDFNLNQYRKQETLRALASLGVPKSFIHFIDAIDGELGELDPIAKASFVHRIVNLISETSPQEVFVTHRLDGHADHIAGCQLVQRAIEESGRTTELFQYLIWMPWIKPFLSLRLGKHEQFLRVHIAGVVEQKRLAIESYRSQFLSLPVGFQDQFEMNFELFSSPPEYCPY